MAKYVHVTLKTPKKKNKLGTYGRTVLDAMTGNENFPNPSPPLATLKANLETLKNAETASLQRLPGSAAACRAAREKVLEDLAHERDYVQSVAESHVGSMDLHGIQAMVESAAMTLRKVSIRPKNVFGATPTKEPGTVELTAPTTRARDPHEWGFSLDQKSWTSLVSTRQAKTRATDLPRGVTIYFRHRHVTKDGPTPWSTSLVVTLP